MRLLDRYTTFFFIGTFLLCGCVFAGLYCIIDLFTHIEEIMKHKDELGLVIQYYLYFLPLIASQTLPFAALLATIFALGKLNRSNELIAMRASGLSLWRVTAPLLIFGLVLSVCLFLLTEKVLPVTQQRSQELRIALFSSDTVVKPNDTFRNLTVYGSGNRLIHISIFEPARNTMKGITVLEHDSRQNITAKIVADKGVWVDDHWVFSQCLLYHFDATGQIREEPKFFLEVPVSIKETPVQLLQQRQRPEFMNSLQLRGYIKRIADSGATAVVRNLKVDLYQKFSQPLAGFILIFLAIPFSLVIRRKGVDLASIGLCIGVSFVYYVVSVVSAALGKTGLLLPWVAAWLGDWVFFLIPLYMLLKIP